MCLGGVAWCGGRAGTRTPQPRGFLGHNHWRPTPVSLWTRLLVILLCAQDTCLYMPAAAPAGCRCGSARMRDITGTRMHRLQGLHDNKGQALPVLLMLQSLVSVRARPGTHHSAQPIICLIGQCLAAAAAAAGAVHRCRCLLRACNARPLLRLQAGRQASCGCC
jgi:hypothetical protein